MGKIVFNIIICTGNSKVGNNGFVTYHKVNSIDKFKTFATGKYPDWKFLTVYNNATRKKIDVIVRS